MKNNLSCPIIPAMPELIAGNLVQLREGESYTKDGITINGFQVVRIDQFPGHDLIQIHGTDTEGNEAKIEIEVEGGTIENFCKKG